LETFQSSKRLIRIAPIPVLTGEGELRDQAPLLGRFLFDKAAECINRTAAKLLRRAGGDATDAA
jgi:hypothetical protein